jgi:low temperature requirement protein LtrA
VASLTKLLRGVRVADESHRVTRFELFFDLVFVFAFTQVTQLMARNQTSIGVAQAMIILALLWWCWSGYGWLANQTRVDEGFMRFGVCIAIVAIFVVAFVIPEAFRDKQSGDLYSPLVFAIAYSIARLMNLALYFVSAGGDLRLRRQIGRTAGLVVIGCALVVAGALLAGQARTWFWLAGFLVDFALTFFTSSGRRLQHTGGDWRIRSVAHWTERYGLVVILALGESIVAIGVGAAQLPISWSVLTAAVLGLILSVCLWWIYFDVVAIAAEQAFAKTEGRARAALAIDGYTYLHLSLIAGIVISALGVEEVLAHINSPHPLGLFGACALLGGTSLYLAGHAAFWKRVGHAWNPGRLVAATILLALIPVATWTTSLIALLVVVTVVAALVAFETVRYADQRETVRRRPGGLT